MAKICLHLQQNKTCIYLEFVKKTYNMEVHYPSRPVDREKAEHDLALNIKKATSPDETAPKQKHVRSENQI